MKCAHSSGGSRPPHVLLVTGSLGSGGAERVMSSMAGYWAERGWRVQLATFSDRRVPDFYPVAAGVERIWLDATDRNSGGLARLSTNLGRVLRLRKLARASRPDAVLSFIDVPNVLTIMATRGLGLRVVVSERHEPGQTEPGGRFEGAYLLGRPWRILRRLVYRWADQVTTVNAEAADWLRSQCGVDVEVIPNALRQLPFPAGLRERLVLGVGRLATQKGFDLLLRAFDRVADGFPDWRLVILGQGSEHAHLELLRAGLKSAARIELPGQAPDVEEWMARAGLIVLPSRFEAYGNAILESLGMGAAVISTPCGGTPSFLNDGVNGRLVPVEDVDALAGVMAELMADPQARRLLGERALKVRETNCQTVIMPRWEHCLFPHGASREAGRS
jgi:GalNAc-alpha-(1->4)-GalNAc-alpha-(1->3)-diNAcBac-PP-undecaprenol alpha-1,4-N-acetyl-D-galactosaminyltransferase